MRSSQLHQVQSFVREALSQKKKGDKLCGKDKENLILWDTPMVISMNWMQLFGIIYLWLVHMLVQIIQDDSPALRIIVFELSCYYNRI